MDDNIFAYDEAEILEDSLRSLDKTLDMINEKFNKVDVTEAIIDHMNRDFSINP